MARYFTSAKVIFENLNKTAIEVGLQINKNKTKIMTQQQYIMVDEYNLENVHNFYLSVQLSKNGNELEK